MILFMCRLVVVSVLHLRIIKMSRKFSYVLTKGGREDWEIGKMGGVCGKYTGRVLF